MKAYPVNKGMGKKIEQKEKGTPPLNPSSMGEYIQPFPSGEGCRFHGGEGAFYPSS